MVKRKIVAQTQNDDWTPKKVRKKRKPMTPEQRLAAQNDLKKQGLQKLLQKNNQYTKMLFLYQMITHYLHRK